MGAGTYDYYTDTRSHGSYTATAQACLAHYLKNETPSTVDLQVIAACRYSSANATGYGIRVDAGFIDEPVWTYNGADGILNYGNWVAWADNTWTVSKGYESRSVKVFVHAWGKTVSGHSGAPEEIGTDRNPEGYYVTIPAKASYQVTYNANGGGDAPANQTKWHGEALTLSNAQPTRTNYTFKGWAATSGATEAQYQPGGTYTGNAAITLYAVWELALIPPSASITAYRVATDQDQDTRESPTGGWGYAELAWSVDTTLDADNVLGSIAATVSEDGGTPQAISPKSAQSGPSGTAIFRWTASTGSAYTLAVTVEDADGASTSRSATVASISYPIYVHDENKVKIHELEVDVPRGLRFEDVANGGDELYSSASGVGANDTIPLDNSAAGYELLDFVFTDGTRHYTARLYNPDGSSISLERSVVSGSTIYHAALMASVSGTTVTLGAGAQAVMSGSSISTSTSNPPLKVIEIRGR